MRIHFVGIAGVSMAWLASYFRANGYEVSGSDITLGGHARENVVGADLVVYTGAVSQDNIELLAAGEAGIPTIERAELLGNLSRSFDKVIAVSGTHGKTTVTGMLSEIIPDSAVHIGGRIHGRLGRLSGSTLVCEACEYRNSFHYINRDIAVVLGVEMDHPDFFAGYEDVLAAFKAFTADADTLITTPELARVLTAKSRIITVSDGGDCFVARFVPGKSIELSLWGRRLCLATPLLGVHNATNLAFAAATASVYGVSDDEIAYGLSRFAGVDRRLQTIATVGSADIISDYAHHPREITASLNAVLGGGRRILTVFQPHTYTRLDALFSGFVDALKGVDSIILPVFAARELYKGGNDGSTLAAALAASGARSDYVRTFSAARDQILHRANDYDGVLIMGAGDVTTLVDMLNPVEK